MGKMLVLMRLFGAFFPCNRHQAFSVFLAGTGSWAVPEEMLPVRGVQGGTHAFLPEEALSFRIVGSGLALTSIALLHTSPPTTSILPGFATPRRPFLITQTQGL